MMNNNRRPLTIWITASAEKQLRKMNARLRDRIPTGKARDVSLGKIVEALVQKEDAHVYVEERLCNE